MRMTPILGVHPVLFMLLVTCLLLMAVACGAGEGGYAENPSSPVPADPAPAEPDAAWDAVKPALARACTKCHNGSGHPLDFNRKAVVLAVKAKMKARIGNGTMPPQGSPITAADKDAILAYLGG